MNHRNNFLALKALQLKLKEVVAQRSHLHGMGFAESVIKDFDGILKVDGRGKGNLHEIHVMDNQGTVIPKEYVVSKLTNSDLEYYESGDKKHKFYFTKQ